MYLIKINPIEFNAETLSLCQKAIPEDIDESLIGILRFGKGVFRVY